MFTDFAFCFWNQKEISYHPQSTPGRCTAAKNNGMVSNSNDAESTPGDTLCLIRRLMWANSQSILTRNLKRPSSVTVQHRSMTRRPALIPDCGTRYVTAGGIIRRYAAMRVARFYNRVPRSAGHSVSNWRSSTSKVHLGLCPSRSE